MSKPKRNSSDDEARSTAVHTSILLQLKRLQLFCRNVSLEILFDPRYKGPAYEDPLQRALDRGSKGLDLLNSPLVLDHVKFTGTLPSWTSRNPFQPTVNEGRPNPLKAETWPK